MRTLTGIQASGTLHLGNYYGAMRPCIEAQDDEETFLFIADFHALTQLPEPQLLRERIREAVVDFLACGIDPQKTIFYRQSDLPEVTELMWILSTVTPMGRMENCHSYKDKTARGVAANHGLFSYPILMAADILLYDATSVPVGKDQKQHLEVTREIAQRFNNKYGDVLIVPEPKIQDQVAVVPGIDGQKMSKSYGNDIPIFGPEKQVRKRFMKIVTDSTAMEDPKDPEICNVIKLYELLASPAQLAELKAKYRAGNFGYGHAKQAAFEAWRETFAPMQAKRDALLANPAEVDAILANGAARARTVAQATLARVRQAVGLA